MTEDLSILTRRGTPADLTLAYGSSHDQAGDIRHGRHGAQLPLLVLMHGGFWRPQHDRAHVEATSSALAAAGWTVLTLGYRRIPGAPDVTVQDIAAALETLPARVAHHNGRIVLIGHSAGGHLALWAAAECATPALQGVVALAPIADLRLAHALRLGNDATRDFLGADPADRPDLDPPQLRAPVVAVTIVRGDADAVVPPAVTASYCEAFPNTRLVQLHASGHFALIDPLSSAWPSVLQELRNLTSA